MQEQQDDSTCCKRRWIITQLFFDELSFESNCGLFGAFFIPRLGFDQSHNSTLRRDGLVIPCGENVVCRFNHNIHFSCDKNHSNKRLRFPSTQLV